MTVIALKNAKSATGLECVAGLSWDTFGKDEWKQKKKEISANHSLFVEIPVTQGASNSVNVGIDESDTPPPSSARTSVAAWVAKSFPQGTIVAAEKVTINGEESYWFCISRDGQVLAGTDTVDAFDEVNEKVSEFTEIISGDDIGFIGDASHLLDSNEYGDAEAQPLYATLAVTAQSKCAIKSGSGSTISTRTLIMAGVMVVALVGMGGLLLTLTSGDSTDAIEAAKRRQMMQKNSAQQNYDTLMSETQSKLHGGSIFANLMDSHIGMLQTKLGGWELQEGECAQGTCTFGYVNEDLTDPSILHKGLSPVCESISVSVEGTEGSCNLKYSSRNNAGETIPMMDERRVKEFRSAIMRYSRHLPEMAYAFSKASEVAFSEKQFLQNVSLFKTGTWGLTFPVDQIPYMQKALKQFPGISVDHIKMNWGSKVIEIQGLYYQEGSSQ